MESWGVVFLGVIALSSALQAAFLVALAVFGRRLGRRLDALQARLDRDIAPALGNLTRVSRAAAEIADLATVRARRLDLVLGDAIDRVEETAGAVRRLTSRPMRSLGTFAALLKGVQAGVQTFFTLGHHAPHGRRPHPARRRHAEDDEHLFI